MQWPMRDWGSVSGKEFGDDTAKEKKSVMMLSFGE